MSPAVSLVTKTGILSQNMIFSLTLTKWDMWLKLNKTQSTKLILKKCKGSTYPAAYLYPAIYFPICQ